MKRITITSMDSDGNVVQDIVTNSKWCLSELDYFLHEMKPQLMAGKISNILIGVIKDG